MKKFRILMATAMVACVAVSVTFAFQSPGGPGSPGGGGSGGGSTPPPSPMPLITNHVLSWSSNGQTPATYTVDSSADFTVFYPQAVPDAEYEVASSLEVSPIGHTTNNLFDLTVGTHNWSSSIATYNGPQSGLYNSKAELIIWNFDPSNVQWIDTESNISAFVQ